MINNLSEDGERELLKQNMTDLYQQQSIRNSDHDLHQKRQEKLADSRYRLDQTYRLHVLSTTALNVIITAAIVAMCIAVIKYVN